MLTSIYWLHFFNKLESKNKKTPKQTLTVNKKNIWGKQNIVNFQGVVIDVISVF